MKVKLVLLSTLLSCSLGRAQFNFEYAHQYVSSNPSIVSGIDYDPSGNIITAGSFNVDIDLNPNAGTVSGSGIGSYGLYDMFVTKVSSTGNYIWSYLIGSEKADYAGDVAVDLLGNVYLTGRFAGTIDFNPGGSSAIYTAQNGYNAFVVKLNNSGAFQWVKVFNGVSHVEGLEIDTDANSDVIVGGTFIGTCSDGSTTLNSLGETDVFISKISATGTVQYLSQIGGTEVDVLNDIRTIGTDVYCGGNFTGSCDISTSGIINVTSLGGMDSYLTKVDVNGNTLWGISFGGSAGDDELNGIGVFINGDVIVGGRYFGTVDFNPGAGISNSTAVGTADAYILKIDANSNYIWSKSVGGTQTEGVEAISVNATNDIMVGGYFNVTVDFDPGPGITNLSSNSGTLDGFLLRLNNTGDFVSVNALNSNSDFVIKDLETRNMKVVLGGYFTGTCDFDFSSSNYLLTNSITNGIGFTCSYNF